MYISVFSLAAVLALVFRAFLVLLSKACWYLASGRIRPKLESASSSSSS